MKPHIIVLHAKHPTFFASSSREVPRDNYVEVAVFTSSSQADSGLNDAYKNTQNIDADWRPAEPCRSTSVGDVLLLVTDSNSHAFEVANLGFEPISLV